MDFSLSEQQEMLRKTVSDFLERRAGWDVVRNLEKSEEGYDPQLWRSMADMGWTGLLLPEDYGGGNGDFVDLCIILEEMGKSIFPSPFIANTVCSLAVAQFGSKAQKDRLLPQVSNGTLILSLALVEEAAVYAASGIKGEAVRQNKDFILSGTKLFVPYAHVCGSLLAFFRTGELETDISCFLVNVPDPTIKMNPLITIALDKEWEVVFENSRAKVEDIVGKINGGDELRKEVVNWGAFCCSAFMLGISERVLEMATAYAKERIQFARPIGSFQAIQHRCANMAIDVDASKFLTYQAAVSLSKGLSTAKIEVAMAKAYVSEACHRVCMGGHQIHAGVGVVIEHPMQFALRWCKLMEMLYGNADEHRAAVAQYYVENTVVVRR